jgi:hypothetical protein
MILLVPRPVGWRGRSWLNSHLTTRSSACTLHELVPSLQVLQDCGVFDFDLLAFVHADHSAVLSTRYISCCWFIASSSFVIIRSCSSEMSQTEQIKLLAKALKRTRRELEAERARRGS